MIKGQIQIDPVAELYMDRKATLIEDLELENDSNSKTLIIKELMQKHGEVNQRIEPCALYGDELLLFPLGTDEQFYLKGDSISEKNICT